MYFAGFRNTADRIATLTVAVALGALAFWCSSGEPSPSLWENLAIAAGARPPMPSTHSLYLAFSSLLLRHLPGDLGYRILWLLGPASVALVTYLAAGLLQMMLPGFLRRQLAERRSHSLLRRFVILPTAALLALSEPIWRHGLYFTPETLHLDLAFVAFYSFIVFRRSLSRTHAIVAAMALGILSVENLFGFAMLAAAAAVMTRDAHVIKSADDINAAAKSTLYASFQRQLTVLVFITFVVGVLVAGWFFVANGGMESSSLDEPRAVVRFLLVYFRRMLEVATPGGWLYLIGLGIIPLVVASMKIGRLLDVEKVLDYRKSLIYIGIGVVAFLQLANFRPLWLWQNNSGPDAVSSTLLLAATMFCLALSLSFALEVLMVEMFYRHYGRFAYAVFGNSSESYAREYERRHGRGRLRPTALVALSLPYALVALSLAWRPGVVERDMFRAVGDYIRLMADDCRSSPVAITDGSVDDALELEMFRRGERGFKALSMLAERTPREVYLRQRGEEKGSEDWIALAVSTPAALRDWVRTDSPRSTNITVQLGFEIWRHERLPMPPVGATAARTGGYAPGEQADLARRARLLGERMLAIAAAGAPFVTSDASLRRLWNFALWRLSRTSRMRADAMSLAGDGDGSSREMDFADRLDEVNLAYQDVRRRTEWVPRRMNSRLAPRDGLRFALQHTDFALASTYARQVLTEDPGDFSGNFAMGMYYVTADQYARALHHLELAHRSRPKDAAALNNLASVEMYLGRLERALEHAEEALRLAPGVPEIKRTLECINHEIGRQR